MEQHPDDSGVLHVRRPKPEPKQENAFRQDLMRGLRWGTLLLLAMLLGVTVYRALYSSPAAASPVRVAQPELAPVQQAPKIEVGEPLRGAPPAAVTPAAAAAPTGQARPKRAAKTVYVVPEPPQRIHAPAFAPLPATKQQAPPVATAFVAAPLPEAAPAPAPSVDLNVTPTLPPAPPAAASDPSTKQEGNRATRAVRSVGRLFRFGRKDPEPKTETEKR